MKKAIHTLIVILITLNGIQAQTSPYKVDEQHYTQNEADVDYYRYNGIDLKIETQIVNVYDIQNYTHSGVGFSTSRAHYVLHSSDGTVSDKTGENYNVNYIDITEGDTLQVSFFEVDSMAGDAWFIRYIFIGRNRNTNGIIEPQAKAENLVVFPNPVTKNIIIKDINTPFSYVIYDINGKAIIGGNSLNENIDLWFLKPGQYIIQLETGDKIYSCRISKI